MKTVAPAGRGTAQTVNLGALTDVTALTFTDLGSTQSGVAFVDMRFDLPGVPLPASLALLLAALACPWGLRRS